MEGDAGASSGNLRFPFDHEEELTLPLLKLEQWLYFHVGLVEGRGPASGIARPGGSWDSNVAFPLSLRSRSQTQQEPVTWTSRHRPQGLLLHLRTHVPFGIVVPAISLLKLL